MDANTLLESVSLRAARLHDALECEAVSLDRIARVARARGEHQTAREVELIAARMRAAVKAQREA